MEYEVPYDIIKDDPQALKTFMKTFVEVKLIQDLSETGFVHAIDPESHSIILLKPKGERFQTVFLAGHAICGIIKKTTVPDITPPDDTQEYTTSALLLKKERLMAWLKKIHLPVTEVGNNIAIRNTLILPPYDGTNIYNEAMNPNVLQQLKEIIEKMPDDFEPFKKPENDLLLESSR